jgi:hypothetical protein
MLKIIISEPIFNVLNKEEVSNIFNFIIREFNILEICIVDIAEFRVYF